MAPSVNHLAENESSRLLFGISREVDWAVGGAAFGFVAGVIQFIANRVLEVRMMSSQSYMI